MSKALLTKTVIPILVVLSASVLIAAGFIKTRPQAEMGKQAPTKVPVTIMEASLTPRQITISAMGTVIPSRELQLMAEVSGRIVSVSDKLVPGTAIRKGDVVARIDARDYKVALHQQEARLQEARAAFEMEKGRQDIARSEWELMKTSGKQVFKENPLVLRKPQLASAEASIKAAESAVYQAQLNLERTTIRSPFNAVVVSKFVEIGQLASPQQPLVKLIGSDSYWVQVGIPMHEVHLAWQARPAGSEYPMATVLQTAGSGASTSWQGMVISRLGDLSPQGRLARLLVEIENPLAAGSTPTGESLPLLIDAYVRVKISGPQLDDVVVISRPALREGNRVWIMNENDTLDIRTVAVAWTENEDIFVASGIEEGERIITSNIAAPVPDMMLKVVGQDDPEVQTETNTG